MKKNLSKNSATELCTPNAKHDNGTNTYHQLYQKLIYNKKPKRLPNPDPRVLESLLLSFQNNLTLTASPNKIEGLQETNFFNGSPNLNGSLNFTPPPNLNGSSNCVSSPNFNGSSNFNSSPSFNNVSLNNVPNFISQSDLEGMNALLRNSSNMDTLTHQLNALSFNPNDSFASDDFLTYEYDPKDFYNPMLQNFSPRQSPMPYSPSIASKLSPRNYPRTNLEQSFQSQDVAFTNGVRDMDPKPLSFPDFSPWGQDTLQRAVKSPDQGYDYYSNNASTPVSSSGMRSNSNSPYRIPSSPRDYDFLPGKQNSLGFQSPNSTLSNDSLVQPLISDRNLPFGPDTRDFDPKHVERKRDTPRLLNQGVIYPAPPELQWTNFEGFGTRDLPQNNNVGDRSIGGRKFLDVSELFPTDGQSLNGSGASMQTYGANRMISEPESFHGRSYRRGANLWPQSKSAFGSTQSLASEHPKPGFRNRQKLCKFAV